MCEAVAHPFIGLLPSLFVDPCTCTNFCTTQLESLTGTFWILQCRAKSVDRKTLEGRRYHLCMSVAQLIAELVCVEQLVLTGNRCLFVWSLGVSVLWPQASFHEVWQPFDLQ